MEATRSSHPRRRRTGPGVVRRRLDLRLVMPLHAPAFGIGLGAVGVVLSLNRIVRILGYGWVTALSHRLGMRTVTAAAALGAALSTLAYGLTFGLVSLLLARLVLGSGLRHPQRDDDRARHRRRPGHRPPRGPQPRGEHERRRVRAERRRLARAERGAPRCVRPSRRGRAAGGAPGAHAAPRKRCRAWRRARARTHANWRPSSLNVLFFTTAVVDGAFATTLSLLFAGTLSATSALLTAGLLLALQRVVVVVLSLVAGPLIDRLGARRLPWCRASWSWWPACWASRTARSTPARSWSWWRARSCRALGPVLATQERSGSIVERLAAFATWVDWGLPPSARSSPGSPPPGREPGALPGARRRDRDGAHRASHRAATLPPRVTTI